MDNDKKFNRFFSLVQQKAKDMGKVFFMDSGEGNEEELDGVIAENLSGWLIDESEQISFSANFTKGIEPEERFDKDFVFVFWNFDGSHIKIKFQYTH